MRWDHVVEHTQDTANTTDAGDTTGQEAGRAAAGAPRAAALLAADAVTSRTFDTTGISTLDDPRLSGGR